MQRCGWYLRDMPEDPTTWHLERCRARRKPGKLILRSFICQTTNVVRTVQPWTVENQNYYFMILPDGQREKAINSTEWHWTKKIPLLLFESNTVFVCLLLLPLVLQVPLSAASTWICCHSLCVRHLKSLAVIAWEFLAWLAFVFLSHAELCCFLNISQKSKDGSDWVLKSVTFPFLLGKWPRLKFTKLEQKAPPPPFSLHAQLV